MVELSSTIKHGRSTFNFQMSAHTNQYSPQAAPPKCEGKRLLPSNFVPSQYSVICGRGKACTSAAGNRRLRAIINKHLQPYSEAKTKLEKSAIVSTIVDLVKKCTTEGGFVKFEEGKWWEVEDSVAREKVGCILRDCLHTQYRSSTKAKLARRRAKMAPDDTSSNSSTRSHFPNASYTDQQSVVIKRTEGGNAVDKQKEAVSLRNAMNIFSLQNEFQQSRLPPVDVRGPSFSMNPAAGGQHPYQSSMLSLLDSKNSLLPVAKGLTNDSHSWSQATAVPNSARSQSYNFLRDIMPVSAHFDIMGASRKSGIAADMESKERLKNNQAWHPGQGVSMLPTGWEDVVGNALNVAQPNVEGQDENSDFPDDISNIFDE